MSRRELGPSSDREMQQKSHGGGGSIPWRGGMHDPKAEIPMDRVSFANIASTAALPVSEKR
jgi:hypothetical protein